MAEDKRGELLGGLMLYGLWSSLGEDHIDNIIGMEEEQPFPLLELPWEMVLHVLDRVPLVDLPSLTRTCSALRDAVIDDGTLGIAVGLSRYTTLRRTDWCFAHASAKRCLQRWTSADLRSLLRLRDFEPRRPLPVGRFNVVLCDDDCDNRRDAMRRVVDAVAEFSKYGLIQSLSPRKCDSYALMPEVYAARYETPGHLANMIETFERTAVPAGKKRLVIVDGLAGNDVCMRYERALATLNVCFLTGECDVVLGVIREQSPEHATYCQLADFICTTYKHGDAFP